MEIKSLVRLTVGVILIHIWPMPSHAAGNDIAPKNTQKEIRFETWPDKAAYAVRLYSYDVRNTACGHLLQYAGTTDVDAILNEPQVQFHLAMLLGDQLPHLLDTMRNHSEINLYGSWLKFEGRGKGDEYAQIQVNLYEAQVEVSLYSGKDGRFIQCPLTRKLFHTAWRGRFSIAARLMRSSRNRQCPNSD